MRDLLLKLIRREDLTREEAAAAFERIMSGSAGEAVTASVLTALATKGATADEIAGAATVMRGHAVPVDTAGFDVIDTCGTGGDVRGTFNISTAAALIAAAAGARVLKHGNRSASSRSGSADVLEELGVRLDVSPAGLTACLREAGICFAFARHHHPAMKHVAPVRQALGIPTLFNLLGPLTNPGRARRQVLGVFAPRLTQTLAEVLQRLGSERAWVVHGDDGLDELSTLAPTTISELRDGAVRTWRVDALDLGLPRAALGELQVTSPAESATAIRGIVEAARGPRRDIALLNAAAALVVAGLCADLPAGLARAAEAVDSGAAARTLEALIRTSRAA